MKIVDFSETIAVYDLKVELIKMSFDDIHI